MKAFLFLICFPREYSENIILTGLVVYVLMMLHLFFVVLLDFLLSGMLGWSVYHTHPHPLGEVIWPPGAEEAVLAEVLYGCLHAGLA